MCQMKTKQGKKKWVLRTINSNNKRGGKKLIRKGDFSGRVSKRDEKIDQVISTHRKQVSNYDGFKLIDFSIINNLIITSVIIRLLSFSEIKKFINTAENSQVEKRGLSWTTY